MTNVLNAMTKVLSKLFLLRVRIFPQLTAEISAVNFRAQIVSLASTITAV